MKLRKYVMTKLKRTATNMFCWVKWIAVSKTSSISKEDIYMEDFKSNRKELIYSKIASFNLIQDGLFGAAHGWGAQKDLPSIKSVTRSLQ